MIAIKLRPGCHLVDVEPAEDGTIEVVAETACDVSTREDADLWTLAHLRSTAYRCLTDAEFRASLRLLGRPWADYIEAPLPRLDEPRRTVSLEEAAELIASEWADPVAPNLDGLEDVVDAWARAAGGA